MLLAVLFCSCATQKMTVDHLKNRVAVLDFKHSANVERGTSEAVTSIFSTYFNPTGFVQVERAQMENILREQKWQSSALSQSEMVKLYELYNVRYVVVGEINQVAGQFNVDLRILDAQTAEVVAKDGKTWNTSDSYRESLEDLANKLAAKLEAYDRQRSETVTAQPQEVKDHWLNRNAIGVQGGAAIFFNPVENIVFPGGHRSGYSECFPPISIAFQRVLDNGNRVEFAFGRTSIQQWNHGYFGYIGLSGTYQSLWRLGGGLHLYAGAGASVGWADSYVHRTDPEYRAYSYGFDLGLLGVLGLEWKFNIPLTLTLDARPWLHFPGFETASFVPTFNLGINYTFGQPNPNKPKRQRNVVVH